MAPRTKAEDLAWIRCTVVGVDPDMAADLGYQGLARDELLQVAELFAADVNPDTDRRRDIRAAIMDAIGETEAADPNEHRIRFGTAEITRLREAIAESVD